MGIYLNPDTSLFFSLFLQKYSITNTQIKTGFTMKKYILLVAGMFFFCTAIFAQTGTAYGFKGGLTFSSQNWGRGETEVLPAYHGVFTVETRDEENGIALFGDAGWHMKGSRIVFRQNIFENPNTGQIFQQPRRSIRQPFNNLSVVIGAKKLGQFTDFINYYYGVGAHADYNLSYDMFYGNKEFFDIYLNKLTYGLSAVGGFEYTLGDSKIFFMELAFHPDINNQIQAFSSNYTNPITNQQTTLTSQGVRNVMVLEISLGLKFVQWN